jgi:uncharacterized protein (AIM24 family)
MSSVVISGDTSGAITLAAPAVAGTTTLTLPATTGNVIASDASANIQFNSGYGSVATAYGCRAWVNFNGTGTVAIRASGNVSSITDNGTGNYTVNFTTAMPDANFAYNITGRASSGSNGQQPWPYSVTAPTTTSVNCVFQSLGAGAGTYTSVDPVDVCVSVFR